MYMSDSTGKTIATNIGSLSVDTSGLVKDTTAQNTNTILTSIKNSIDNISQPTARNIDYDNATSGLTATDVQGAIDELSEEKQDNIILGGITAPNFNNLTTSGCHWVVCSNSTNSPFADPTGKYGLLEIVKGTNTIIMQRFTEYRSDSTLSEYGGIHIRFYANSRWYSWKQKV